MWEGTVENLTGKQLGQYRLIAPLGEGGMATVYKSYQPSMEREVALKILPRQYASEPDFVHRFQREAHIIANLQHPHILPVYDYGESDGYPYLVMRYVEGQTLNDRLKGQPIPLPEASRMISQIASALDYAHAHEVVHRDVKPSNVLIDDQGNCLLSDFGLAKVLLSVSQLTASGAFIGTPTYASPEQCLGREAGPRSDIYSLGVILYQMATGRPPFDADTPMAIVIKHVHDPLPMPRSFNPALPEAVERVILKALAKEPQYRYATAGELAGALSEAVQAVDRPTLPETRRYSSLPSLVGNARRIPAWGWVLGCLAVVGLLAGLVAGIFLAIHPASHPKPTTPRLPTSTRFLTQAAPAARSILTPTSARTTNTPGLPSLTPRAAATSTGSAAPLEPGLTQPVAALPLPSTAEGVGRTIVSDQDGMTLVYVPVGDFWMGSDANRDRDTESNEEPIHRVYLDAFWIDKTEVTNAMFNRCIQDGVCAPGTQEGGDDNPVVNVRWEHARTYCEWAGRQLPTEAQWEKAARGTDARIYPWGNQSPDCTLASYDPETGICVENNPPVGSYPAGASPYDALDMAGSVSEWVRDWYDPNYYAVSPAINPTGPDSGEENLTKGGSWGNSVYYLRSAYRYSRYLDFRDSFTGFRCALPESQTTAPAPTGAPTPFTTLTPAPTPPAIQVLQQFKAPSASAGIAWDGSNLWISDGIFMDSIQFLKVNETGSTTNVFKSNVMMVWAAQIAWAGQNLWLSETEGIHELKITGDQVEEVSQYPPLFSVHEINGPYAITWDGNNLWLAQGDYVFQMDQSGNFLENFVYTQTVEGLGWDGTYLWIATNSTLDSVDTDGQTLASFTLPITETGSLAWDGHDLWVLGYDTVYQLDITQAQAYIGDQLQLRSQTPALFDVLSLIPLDDETLPVKIVNNTGRVLKVSFEDYNYTEQIEPGGTMMITPPGTSFVAEVPGLPPVRGQWYFGPRPGYLYAWTFNVRGDSSEPIAASPPAATSTPGMTSMLGSIQGYSGENKLYRVDPGLCQ